jgi:hypothetical protein
MKIFVLVFIIILSSVAVSGAEGLHELIAVAKSQADIQDEYSDETRTFDRVKRGIEKGEIKTGQSREEITSRYGEPIVKVDDAGTGRERWVYKPASSTYFKGIKACLFFGKDGKLDETSLKNEQAKEKETDGK